MALRTCRCGHVGRASPSMVGLAQPQWVEAPSVVVRAASARDSRRRLWPARSGTAGWWADSGVTVANGASEPHAVERLDRVGCTGPQHRDAKIGCLSLLGVRAADPAASVRCATHYACVHGAMVGQRPRGKDGRSERSAAGGSHRLGANLIPISSQRMHQPSVREEVESRWRSRASTKFAWRKAGISCLARGQASEASPGYPAVHRDAACWPRTPHAQLHMDDRLQPSSSATRFLRLSESQPSHGA